MATNKKTTAASAKDVESNEEVKLNDAEKDALEKQEASAQNKETSSGKYKLANPDSSYQEPGFTLVGDQEKELPEDPSNDLIARIQSGFIVKA